MILCVCVCWGVGGDKGRRKEGSSNFQERGKEPQKKRSKTNFRSQQSHFLQLQSHCSCHTRRTIFSSLFDQLLRLQNGPLKHEAPSGENDFQPTQRPHRLNAQDSGVGCPNLPCRCITRFSRVILHEEVGLGCPRALSLFQQTLLHREKYGLCVSALGFLDLIKGTRGVTYKFNYSLAKLRFPCLFSLPSLPTTHLLHNSGLLGKRGN